jgi:4-hydroxybenzoate polyprenyltransferase
MGEQQVTVRAARLVVMMIRPPVAVLLLLFAALGMAPAGRADGFHPLFTTVLVIVGGWFVHATVLNDLADESIDRVNLAAARGRPLVTGEATRSQLTLLGNVAAAVALVLAFTVNWRVGVVVAAGLVLNAAYSLRPVRISHRGAVASLMLPLGYVALPYLVGALSVQPSLGRTDLVLLAGLYVTFIGRILLKDFRDVSGDGLFGKRTFLLRHGRQATCLASAACWVAGTATLLALVPVRSFLVAVFAVYLGCALHGLHRLATTSGHIAEQVTIGAIAQVGRGMAITLLAHFTMLHKGWPPAGRGLVMLTLGILFATTYLVTLAQRDRVLAIRPY